MNKFKLDLTNEKCVVTGGAGFIGSNLSQKLANLGAHVTVIDDFSTGNIENLRLLPSKSSTIISDTVTNAKKMDEVLKEQDFVFHLAACSSIPLSVSRPSHTSKINLGGTLNVINSSLKSSVKKIIFSSSCSIYGNPSKFPIDENFANSPQSPYAQQKLDSEINLEKANSENRLSATSLRFFNVYGPKQSLSTDYAAVIPKFFESCLSKNNINIFGNGQQTRDFVYVDDVVDAMIKTSMSKESNGHVINIASGNETKINTLAEIIKKRTNKDNKIVYKNSREGDLDRSWANIKKAKNMLNYSPKTDIHLGIKKTYKSIIE